MLSATTRSYPGARPILVNAWSTVVFPCHHIVPQSEQGQGTEHRTHNGMFEYQVGSYQHIILASHGREPSKQGLGGDKIFEAEKETFLEHVGVDANAAQAVSGNGRAGKSKKEQKKAKTQKKNRFACRGPLVWVAPQFRFWT